ncbi:MULTISPECIES: helix-turn-helix transcriptional regulator [unclassified Adlercreutzia]|uniref:helix-turn-helix transcriptional regulator n=1 Tax=unclassified Adlercreutzia TaxID=2636013 RepID=UPI0013EBB602|nr:MULTISPECIES: helix-turn-helix transcriptional regulator [unclassified Adlercreutzia]
MNFRDNLVHLRAVNNMTQEQLAMRLGVSRQSVAKWEAGKSYPEMDKLLALCQVFSCTLDELVQGDLTAREADSSLAVSGSAQPEDVFGYDEQMRSFANKISNGVMAIILGVALCAMFGAIGEASEGAAHAISSNVFVSLSILLLFAGIAAGLALIIPAAMSHSAFVKAHPYVSDFYRPEDKARARSAFSRELIGGICCIFLGVCAVVFLADTSYEDVLGTPVMLSLIAVGVRFIIHGGMMLGRTNLHDYNKSAGEYLTPEEIASSDLPHEQKQQMISAHESDKRIGAICGAVMMLATIVGLVLLFASPFQLYFWLAWVVGGLLCGIIAVLMKAFSANA